jgi:preprotein translocase subunit SecD
VSTRWRVIWIAFVVLGLGYLGAANFADKETREASWWLPDEGLRLGLDLQGGVHMVIAPDLAVAVDQELNHLRKNLEERLGDDGVSFSRLAVVEDQVELELTDVSQAAAVDDVLVDDFDVLRISQPEPGKYSMRLTPTWEDEVLERAMLQALEVIRRRVDDPGTGIPESVVTRQGDARILVQIPGVSDVPDIFDRTGFLEFKIVQDAEAVENGEELLRARYPDGLPEGTEIAFEVDRETDRVLGAYLVPEAADITGELLTDARVAFDSRRSEWLVRFTWNAEGGRIFGDLTEKNINEPLGVILDNQVYNAPIIRDRISREGQITGNFSSEEAASLAVILRAGALPIPVILEEERTIGPALGADSIRAGLRASMLGLILVFVFMLIYYRMSGSFAGVALLVNLIMVVGLMSLFEGTLTLPGIAGLVLTIGMAVDANVIIFERIREELRTGRAVRPAISTGFQKALWTILDANITTFITALILYNYGTGPIKGFAVTLSVGILTSVFAALVITRTLFMLYPGQRNAEQLSI